LRINGVQEEDEKVEGRFRDTCVATEILVFGKQKTICALIHEERTGKKIVGKKTGRIVNSQNTLSLCRTEEVWNRTEYLTQNDATTTADEHNRDLRHPNGTVN